MNMVRFYFNFFLVLLFFKIFLSTGTLALANEITWHENLIKGTKLSWRVTELQNNEEQVTIGYHNISINDLIQINYTNNLPNSILDLLGTHPSKYADIIVNEIPQYLNECLLRDVHAPELLHPLLSRFLLFL